MTQKKKFLIAPILFLYYELSVCPLILNFNKVYLAASLIAKPTQDTRPQAAQTLTMHIFE
jgi:hypothetical protein